MSKMKYNPITGELDTVDVCVTSEDITIDAESPLAESLDLGMWPEYWKDPDGNPIIPKGETLDSILQELFVKTVNGTVAWEIGEIECNVRHSQFNYTPIIECGGKWTLISDQSSALENVSIPAVLSASHGYFTIANLQQWRNDRLVVNVPVTAQGKSITYIGNGATMTRDAGNWVNYSMPPEVGNRFGLSYAISERNTYSFSVAPAIYHDPVYPSNNKKRIIMKATSLFGSNIPSDKLENRMFEKTVKIYNSYYYFAGIDNECPEFMIDGDPRHLPIKDFVHQYDKDRDTVILPREIAIEETIDPGQTFVIAIPSVCGFSSLIDYNKFSYERNIYTYTLPDGTEVEYNVFTYTNITEDAIKSKFLILNP